MFERDLRLWAKVEWCVRPVHERDTVTKFRIPQQHEIRQLRDVIMASCASPRISSSRFFCPPHSTRRRDSKRYFPRSEQEVFEILGLEWIDPTLRNADS
jgi:hypothetical protein